VSSCTTREKTHNNLQNRKGMRLRIEKGEERCNFLVLHILVFVVKTDHTTSIEYVYCFSLGVVAPLKTVFV